jgi:hypothetical protein
MPEARAAGLVDVAPLLARMGKSPPHIVNSSIADITCSLDSYFSNTDISIPLGSLYRIVQ